MTGLSRPFSNGRNVTLSLIDLCELLGIDDKYALFDVSLLKLLSCIRVVSESLK